MFLPFYFRPIESKSKDPDILRDLVIEEKGRILRQRERLHSVSPDWKVDVENRILYVILDSRDFCDLASCMEATSNFVNGGALNKHGINMDQIEKVIIEVPEQVGTLFGIPIYTSVGKTFTPEK